MFSPRGRLLLWCGMSEPQNLDRMADRLNHPPEGEEHDEDCPKFHDEDADCECWELVQEQEEREYQAREDAREWQRKILG